MGKSNERRITFYVYPLGGMDRLRSIRPELKREWRKTLPCYRYKPHRGVFLKMLLVEIGIPF